ncbi:MAG: DUF2335 domain-containing protein [Nitrospirae bacterium]|nr:DUF2335 domain-containing protein [Nitrospirota bacterium]
MKVVGAVYSGPIPPASEFAKYEEALPGAADRILKMTEIQGLHRQELEKKVIDIESRNSLYGLVFAFILSLILIVGSMALVYSGHGWIGASLGFGGLLSLVGTFIHGSKQRRLEREKNIDRLSGK